MTGLALLDEYSGSLKIAKAVFRTFVMDAFKRVYSNEDTAKVAIPYFWENFDAENYSIWYGEYKYPEDLTLTFMSCNLIGGKYRVPMSSCRTMCFYY